MFVRLMQAARCDPHLTGSRGLNLNEQPSLHPACHHDAPGRAAAPGRADPAQLSPLELEAWSEPRTSRMSRLRRMIMMLSGLSPHRAARQLEGTCRGRTSRGRSPRARCPWDPDSRSLASSRPNGETGIPSRAPFPGQIGNLPLPGEMGIGLGNFGEDPPVRTQGSAVLACLRLNAPASRAGNATRAVPPWRVSTRKIHDVSQHSACHGTLSDVGASIITGACNCAAAHSPARRTASQARPPYRSSRGEPRWPRAGNTSRSCHPCKLRRH
jgi:hypothetical protein